MFWLPGPGALVPGDRLIGDGEGGVRLCPQSWLDSGTVEELRVELEPLLELPVEHVLCSHWDPVIGGGHAALQRAATRLGRAAAPSARPRRGCARRACDTATRCAP